MVPADVNALPDEPVQRTRRMTLSAIWISLISASLCRWSSQSASSSVKVIGVLSWAYLGNSVTSPAANGVYNSRSTKDGVDYMFLLRLVCPIARSRILSDGRRRSAARPGWDNYSLYKLPQMAISDQQLDLVSKLYAVLSVVAHILVKVAVFILVSPSTIHPEWRWVSEQSSTRHLVKDVLDGCDQWGVLLKSPRWYSRTGIEIRLCALDHGLPLFWSALVGLVSIRLPSRKPGLFLGYQPSPSDVFVRFGMPLGDPPQMCKGGWLVVGKRPDEAGVFDAFSEGLYEGVVRAALDLHDGLVKALEILFQHFSLALLYAEQEPASGTTAGQLRLGSSKRTCRGQPRWRSELACGLGSFQGAHLHPAGQSFRPALSRIAGPRAGRTAAGGNLCDDRDSPSACPWSVLGLYVGRSLVFPSDRKRKSRSFARPRPLPGHGRSYLSRQPTTRLHPSAWPECDGFLNGP
ncbi:hypothetical protein TIFTF001_053860 [Ficus carica]|uniref:Uncharacterized protein n=1 Tax=Ficus carica TaxID=3494 RepID=A0AA88JIZ7_FICCA|nr:hypothetical protein TIFTF001_053860 [Ficus carica]